MEDLVIGVVAFLATVLAVSVAARRVRISAPLALVVVGVAGSYVPFVHAPELAPELILVVALPPLLYASAITSSLVDFRRQLSSIGWLSVGLVIFTTFGVGTVVHYLLGIAWAPALALGAVVAPPDAVAATAVARTIGLPRRVVTLLEGESLVNDATALVSLRTAVAAMGAAVTVGEVGRDFAVAVIVAVLVGLTVALVVSWVFRRASFTSTSTALSLMTPFLAFVPAEHLHGSGVLAVVVAGLVLGHKSPAIQSGEVRLAQRINWTTIQFILENSVFLLVGLQFRQIVSNATGTDLTWTQVAGVCAATLGTVIVLRVVWLLATRLLVHLGPRKQTMTTNETLVVSWAGMRGVVTLAAALTLPTQTPYRAVLILCAFTVTLGTLLIQGLTLPWLALRLGVHGPDAREDALQEAALYRRAFAAGMEATVAAARPGDEETVERLQELGERRVNGIWERLGHPEGETPAAAYRRLRSIGLEAERAEVLTLRDAGEADHHVVREVLAALDIEEAGLARLHEADEQTSTDPLRPRLRSAPCEHLADAHAVVVPLTPGICAECQAEGLTPVHLRLCLECGHVGCCDSSAGRHATKHFEETGHPVMRSIEPGEDWRWCYVDEVLGAGEE
ncbi:Na+/H+ antiporter [Nigerium massiliense]|uniref:Na+/H+ antiporter n=1 Tax=Nigerium massiliense TaxID=1522317 RepID=UPI00058AF376|nr:Na+/H+ antiporter [Nigerium massiliense]